MCVFLLEIETRQRIYNCLDILSELKLSRHFSRCLERAFPVYHRSFSCAPRKRAKYLPRDKGVYRNNINACETFASSSFSSIYNSGCSSPPGCFRLRSIFSFRSAGGGAAAAAAVGVSGRGITRRALSSFFFVSSVYPGARSGFSAPRFVVSSLPHAPLYIHRGPSFYTRDFGLGYITPG